MDSPPSLGVVVPTLDEETNLRALLERLTPLGRGPDLPDELVVADGGSRDRTVEVARAGGARVVRAPTGRGSQLAAGAQVARSDVLLFLHADCRPHAGALARVREAFADGRPRWGGLRQRIDADGAFFRWVEACAAARVRLLSQVLGDSGLALSAELYRAVGGFDPLPVLEDVALSRRLRRHARAQLIEGAWLGVSARRWRSEGALRATLRNWMIQLAYAAGADPRRLARFYPPPASPPRTS